MLKKTTLLRGFLKCIAVSLLFWGCESSQTESNSSGTRRIGFINHTDEPLTIVVWDTAGYSIKEVVKPKSTLIQNLSIGAYAFSTINSKEEVVLRFPSVEAQGADSIFADTTKYVQYLDNEGDTFTGYRIKEFKYPHNTNVIWYDLSGKSRYVVANLDKFYEGGGILHKSGQEFLKNQKFVKQVITTPGMVGFDTYQNFILPPFLPIYKELKLQKNHSALVYIPEGVTGEDAITEYVLNEILSREPVSGQPDYFSIMDQE